MPSRSNTGRSPTPGSILQVDDAWLPALWDRIGIEMGLDAFRKRCELRVEALNHALEGIPEEQVRYHLCWGSWHGPHVYDLEFKHLVDIMLKVNAQAYLIEGANARHEHEWTVWQDTKLPDGKILIPGVVTHSTDVVEHPESSRSACRTTRVSWAKRTSSQAPIAVSAGARTPRSPGPS